MLSPVIGLPSTKSSSKLWVAYLLLVLVSALNYFYCLKLPAEQQFYSLLLIQSVQFLLLGIFWKSTSLRELQDFNYFFLFGIYCFSRFFLFQSDPVLEDDFHRYFWDGQVLNHGINPYLYPPNSSSLDGIVSHERALINFPWVGTIYPPVAQIFFGSFIAIFDASIFAFRACLAFLEIILAIGVFQLCRELKKPSFVAFLLLFVPTLMKENINSIHFDLLAVTLSVWSLVFFLKQNFTIRSSLVPWIFLAAAILTKWYCLFWLPFFWKFSSHRSWGFGVFSLACILWYLPFYEAGHGLLSGTQVFAQEWHFFASVPTVLQIFFDQLVLVSDSAVVEYFPADSERILNILKSGILARWICGLAFFSIVVFWTFQTKKKTDCLWLVQNSFVLLLLLSPVVNSWYLLWGLPFYIIGMRGFSFGFFALAALSVLLGYSWFLSPQLYQQLHHPGYGLFLVGLLFSFNFRQAAEPACARTPLFGTEGIAEPLLSVIIPSGIDPSNTFLNQTLAVLTNKSGVELILIDTKESNSRAERLNIGFARSRGSMVLFHHPRSVLDLAGIEYLIQNSNQKIWGGFVHEFDYKHPILEWTSWYSNSIRGRIRGILYLDHCIFFHRELWLGKIPQVDIFEDTLLSVNLRSQLHPVLLPFRSRTSALRFIKNGIFRQVFLNQLLKLGFHIGVSDRWMNRLYEKGLSLNSKYEC